MSDAWIGPGEKPHSYSPDVMAMGDCRICGHTREAHQAAEPPAVSRPAQLALPLTAADLADALSCFWNAAIGEAHTRQSGMETASIMAMGISAVETRLREIANTPAPDPRDALAFGNGSLVVDTGSFSGVPATFICPAKQPGEIGSSAEREGNPKDTLQPGEVVLTFPTEAQASRVADALVNAPCTRDALIKELVGALRNSSATIVAVYQWLEMVEKEGGATSIAGVAKCHAMLTSLRKNADRTEKLIMTPARDALTRANEAGYGAQERNGDES